MLAEAIAVSLFTSDLYIEGAAEKEGFIGKYFPHSAPLHSHSMNSKKHWPSIFMKSKSSTSPETSNSSPLYPGEGALSHNDVPGRERIIPIAKTRWHPKPDQIQILEAIFNSGMVNPPREEIKRIRAQLQEFGHVEDVNVFYWFQNSKARSKRKRQLQDAGKSESRSKRARALSSSSSTSPSTSTSTSVQSQPTTIGNQPPSAAALPASSFAEHHYNQQVNQEMGTTQYSNMQPVEAGEKTESRGILNEAGAREDLISMDNSLITVFINDIPIQLPMGPINFHAFFGYIALLLDSSGHLVLVNESGFTMEGLEHGAKYFLI